METGDSSLAHNFEPYNRVKGWPLQNVKGGNSLTCQKMVLSAFSKCQALIAQYSKNVESLKGKAIQ